MDINFGGAAPRSRPRLQCVGRPVWGGLFLLLDSCHRERDGLVGNMAEL